MNAANMPEPGMTVVIMAVVADGEDVADPAVDAAAIAARAAADQDGSGLEVANEVNHGKGGHTLSLFHYQKLRDRPVTKSS